MNPKTLHDTALGMVAKGRGILAADESTSTIGKRFDSIKVENTEENRSAYRDMLFSAAGIEKYTSGVIFYEETLFQKAADGTPFPKMLAKKGIIPGIRSTRAPRTSPARRARPSPRASTACASAWPSTRTPAPASPSGVR